MDNIFFLGRVLFGGYFLYNAYNHLIHSQALAGYAQSKGVPMARLAVIFSGLLLLLGGYCVVAGVRPVLGALALALFLIPVTFQMHAFWKETDPNAKAMQQIQFGKNMALLGAALMMVMISTPWPLSLGN
jgi:putative oxidoreductase